MNFLSDDDSEPHLTQKYYEQSLGFGQLLNEENINNFDELVGCGAGLSS
jgi:hypothetical protein